MVKNFVLEVIETLLPQELESLVLFLESPYFNRGFNSKVLSQLFDLLLTYHRQNEIENLDKQQLFEALFPGKPFVDSKIDKLMTEMKGLIQTFLITEQHLSEQNENQQSLELTREMRLRGLESRYLHSFEKLKKQSASIPYQSVKNHLFSYFIAVEEHEWHSVYNKSKGDLNIPEVLHHLEIYYAAQKTEMLNRLLLQHMLTKLPDPAKSFFDPPWNISPDSLGISATVDISWEIHLLLRTETPEIDGFFRLLKTIQSCENEIEPETLAQYYTYLRNICIRLINEGLLEFYGVLHEINKDNIERGYYFFQNKIAPNAYVNITQVALNVNDIEWAKAFVDKYKDMITGENETRDFYRMNVALCLFAEKKFEEALEYIPFGSSYSHYHLMARRLELKIYYELKSDLLEFKIDAFKMFISRAGNKALSKDLYELFVNFINFLRQLTLSPMLHDKTRAEKMIKRINEKKLVAERTWLLEKARELGERKK